MTGVLSRIGRNWRALSSEQRLAAMAALALLLSMLLPWYHETGNALVGKSLQSIDDSKSAFGVYSFVEAAIFVVVAGVLVLLWARAERKAFHLPGGDGTVIMGAGLWVMLLISAGGLRSIKAVAAARTASFEWATGAPKAAYMKLPLSPMVSCSNWPSKRVTTRCTHCTYTFSFADASGSRSKSMPPNLRKSATVGRNSARNSPLPSLSREYTGGSSHGRIASSVKGFGGSTGQGQSAGMVVMPCSTP